MVPVRTSVFTVLLVAGCFTKPEDLTGGGGPVDRYGTLAIGGRHACAVDADRALYCRGDNSRSDVRADRADSAVLAPTRIDAGEWTAVATGGQHTCTLRDGDVHCW